MKNKVCRECGEDKPVHVDPEISRFDKQRASADGFRPVCKPCFKIKKVSRRQVNEVSSHELTHWNGIDSVYC